MSAGHTRPLVVIPCQESLEIPLDLRADRLHFLGNVTLPDGFPITGRFGEVMARYVLIYDDGERQEVPLRWGVEVARSNMVAVGSRIDPSTAHGERVIVYSKDITREVYQTRLLSLDLKQKKVVRLRCELVDQQVVGTAPPPDMHHARGPALAPGDNALLLFAITAERQIIRKADTRSDRS